MQIRKPKELREQGKLRCPIDMTIKKDPIKRRMIGVTDEVENPTAGDSQRGRERGGQREYIETKVYESKKQSKRKIELLPSGRK